MDGYPVHVLGPGSPNIVHDGTLEVPIGNVIRTMLWLET